MENQTIVVGWWGAVHNRLGHFTLPGNDLRAPGVYWSVTLRAGALLPALIACSLGAIPGDYTSAQQKFALIEAEHLRPGARVTLTLPELTAVAQHDLPEGVRNPKLQIVSPGVVTGSALVDFGKIRRAQGYHPGWLMSKLLDGERPVSVTARIQSGAGRATVYVQKVEISDLTVDGRSLDFLIQNFLIPLYPDAAVDRPFEMGHRIEKLDIQPSAVAVFIGR